MGMTVVTLLTVLPLHAQSWAKQWSQAVFTLKTFSADGSLLASSNGFFTGQQGEAVSAFKPFRGAHRAVIIDADGKEHAVIQLMGANDLYDVAKFQVDMHKPVCPPIATKTVPTTGLVWLMPYATKQQPRCTEGTVAGSESFQSGYDYYTLNLPADEQQAGCPVFNQEGQVIGLLQPATTGSTQSYAVSARFANDLHTTGLSINDATLRSTAIPIALPTDYDEALLSLYVASSVMEGTEFEQLVDRFIQQFPQAADGYIYRARLAAANGRYQQADDDMQKALKVATKKDDAHYQYAQLIYQKVVYQPQLAYEPWSLERALGESEAAYRLQALPVYLQQQAQIRFAMQQYADAYDLYMLLTKGELRGAEVFFAASQCKAQLGDRETQLALLDSAVHQFTKPYPKTAAPYLLVRAQARYEAGKYRQAVGDYNAYGELMAAQLTAEFYYQREQAELAGHLYQQALNDIRQAVDMAPQEPLYLMEQAAVEVRVGMNDEAIATARRCIAAAPDQSDGYLFLGLAQCQKGQKQEGLQNLQKAKELGNGQAQSLIDKYSRK